MCKFFQYFYNKIIFLFQPIGISISPTLLIFFGVFFINNCTAALIFTTEDEGTKGENFTLDSDSTATEYIDLDFGTYLDSKLRFDLLNNKFVLNKSIDFTGNELKNFRIESLGNSPLCDEEHRGRMYNNLQDNKSYICNGKIWKAIDLENNGNSGVGNTGVLAPGQSLVVSHDIANPNYYLNVTALKIIGDIQTEFSDLFFDKNNEPKFLQEDANKTDFLVEKLILQKQTGENLIFNTSFDNPADYIFDNAKIKINNGKASLKENIILDSLVGYWRFDNDKNPAYLADYSGNNHTLQNINNVNFVNGKIGDCANFNEDNHLRLEDHNDFDLQSEGTISVWIYLEKDVKEKYAGLVHKGDSPYWFDEAYSLQFWSNQKIRLVLSSTQWFRGSNELDTQKKFKKDQGWQHIVGMWNPSGMYLYVNGKLDNSSNKTGILENSSGGLNIGAQLHGHRNNHGFNGKIDEVMIYNKSLTENQISELYNQGKSIILQKYPNDNPTLITKTSHQNTELSKFVDFLVSKNGAGDLGFQLSTNRNDWLHWNGNSWIIGNLQSYNTESQIKNNIQFLESDNLFLKIFFISDGSSQIELDNIDISYQTNGGYPTNKIFFVSTTDHNQFESSTWAQINKLEINNNILNQTNIKYLVSFDQRKTWKYWAKNSWQTAGNDLYQKNIFANANNADVLNNLTSLHWNDSGGFISGQTSNINFAAALKTDDESITPEITNIKIFYNKGTQNEVWRKIQGTEADFFPIDFISDTEVRITNLTQEVQTIKLFVK